MKKTKKILSLILTGAMVFSMGIGALAIDGGSTAAVYDLSDSCITKKLTVADGVTPPADFTFSFTSKGSETAAVEDHPAVSEQTITVSKDANETDLYTGTLAFSEFFAIGDFPHAGEYVYEVKETTQGYENVEDGDAKKTLNVDSAVYTVRVYVINSENGLVFNGVTVEKADEKVDPTNGEFLFENLYEEMIESPEGGVLTVTKTITGAYGDKTKKFPVIVELTIPAVNDAATDIALADGSAGTLNGSTVTAELADGEFIKFSKIPAGTTFVVKETQDAAYKSKTTGYVETEDTEYVTGDVEKKGKDVISAAGNEVSIENNREDTIPTGVVINNLPYALAAVIAALGFAYLRMKKRV